MPTATQVEHQRRLLQKAGNLSRRQAEKLIALILSRTAEFSEIRDLLKQGIPSIINSGAEGASALAAQWYESVYAESAAMPKPIGLDRIEGAVGWSMSAMFNQADIDRSMLTLLEVVESMVIGQGKNTISASGKANGRRFARIPSGPSTCEWCMMLASRGYVYTSAESARLNGNGHDACLCSIVPEDNTTVSGYDPADLYKIWQEIRVYT